MADFETIKRQSLFFNLTLATYKVIFRQYLRFNRPSAKFAFEAKEQGSTERKNGVNMRVNEDLSTAVTPLFSTQVEFRRGSNADARTHFHSEDALLRLSHKTNDRRL